MIEHDTIRLLRQCDFGIKMGVSSIDEVLGHIESKDFKEALKGCRNRHLELGLKIQELLHKYHDEGKEPNLMVKGMSWLKTGFKLAADGSDEAIADLMTDGCNMGAKSLRRYLNEFEGADEKSKDIAKSLINIEEELVSDIGMFL